MTGVQTCALPISRRPACRSYEFPNVQQDFPWSRSYFLIRNDDGLYESVSVDAYRHIPPGASGGRAPPRGRIAPGRPAVCGGGERAMSGVDERPSDGAAPLVSVIVPSYNSEMHKLKES